MKRKLAAAMGREISALAHQADPSCKYKKVVSQKTALGEATKNYKARHLKELEQEWFTHTAQ